MRKISVIFIALISFVHTYGQFNQQSKKVTKTFFPEFEEVLNITPALQKKKGFTTDIELLDFLENLKNKYTNKVELLDIGNSMKGKAIKMVVLTNPLSTEKKIKVWMQGGLHGNEPASTEGMLYLISELLNNKDYSYLLDRVELAIVPMCNIDGYIKNNRYASNGLDLNRDQTKLNAQESIALKKAIAKFNPDVAVDFHEYNPYRKDFAQMSSFGITSAYDAMFLYSGNLNVPESLRNFTKHIFVNNAKKAMDSANLRHHDYISTSKHYGDIQFNQGSNNARSSATSYALKNIVSSLIEVRGVNINKTSFKRRTYTTFLIAISYLETTFNNRELIKKEIQKAINTEKPIVVKSKKAIYTDTIDVIDLDSNKLIPYEVTISDALQSSATLERKRPESYFIKKDQTELVEKIKAFGIEIDYLKEDSELIVESYNISSYHRNSTKYEQINQQEVSTQIEERLVFFPKGTIILKMNQRKSNLLAELLEPEAPNSFVSFGVLKTEKGAILPIYRKL